MYRNVVVAYDGSEGAKAALARAVEIATRDDSALTVVEATPRENPGAGTRSAASVPARGGRRGTPGASPRR